MTKLINTTHRPLGALLGYSQLPALFNEHWLKDVFSAFDNGKWDAAFDQHNVHYPYDVSVKNDHRGNAQEYRLDIALAGLDKDCIRLSVKDRQLIIEINKNLEKSLEEKEENVTWLKNGISYRSAKLQFSLGKDVDIKKISSSFKDGLLRVVIPVTQPEITDIDISVK